MSLNFGGFSSPKPATSQTTGISAAPLGGLSFGATPSLMTTSAPAPITTTTTAASTATSLNTNTITFKVLEDQINNWMRDLDEQEKVFLDQACQLNGLDRIMIDNGEKIVDLNTEVNRLNDEQDKLDQDLEFIMSQQTHLEQSIKKLETCIDQMPIVPNQYADKDRLQTYQLLLGIDTQLNSMSGDLKEIIQRLNTTNVNLNDPAVQISKILNAHMDSLSWIEENTNLVQKQVDHLSKAFDDRLRDHDKSSRYQN